MHGLIPVVLAMPDRRQATHTPFSTGSRAPSSQEALGNSLLEGGPRGRDINGTGGAAVSRAGGGRARRGAPGRTATKQGKSPFLALLQVLHAVIFRSQPNTQAQAPRTLSLHRVGVAKRSQRVGHVLRRRVGVMRRRARAIPHSDPAEEVVPGVRRDLERERQRRAERRAGGSGLGGSVYAV
ncbi:hypothetical protein FB451DRAFT_1264920 [Mycena latifolia]|nr:hypothetical protein FB451DRAFT_1264920 [Mycena latifolia]